MTDQQEESFFKCLDGNTLFSAVYAWMQEDDTKGTRELRDVVGTWAWEDVRTVQQMHPNDFPEMSGPRCAVQAGGGWIHLRADYQLVLRAWRAYRLRYNGLFLNFTQAN